MIGDTQRVIFIARFFFFFFFDIPNHLERKKKLFHDNVTKLFF